MNYLLFLVQTVYMIQAATVESEKESRIDNYPKFYQFYLSQHSKPATKLFHFIGTGMAMFLLFLFISDFR